MLQNLIIYNNKIVCPRCDGNGFLYMSTLQPINISIIICDECEAVWPLMHNLLPRQILKILLCIFNFLNIHMMKLSFGDQLSLVDLNVIKKGVFYEALYRTVLLYIFMLAWYGRTTCCKA